MGKERFHFDPVAHRFQTIKKSRSKRIIQPLLMILASLFLAILVRYTIDHSFIHPKETKLRKEKEMILNQYLSCEKRIRDLELAISGIQSRDDHIYRVYYEMDPVPASLREAGLGGSNRYRWLKAYDSSGLVIDLVRRVDLAEIRMEIQGESFSELSSRAEQHISLLQHRPSIQPVSLQDFFWISSGYGYRTDPVSKRRAMHYGVDFAGRKGLDVHATGDGIVKYINISKNGFGKLIIIDHGFGYTTLYGHLSSILVRRGQKIRRGMVIGKIGDTGKSTGPHLHYEVRLHNRPVNPGHYYADDITAGEYAEIISLSE